MIIMDKYASEFFAIMLKYGGLVSGKTDEEVFELQRQENKELAECCAKHKRELDYVAGEKVEPVTHFAEAVLVGVGQQGGI